VRDEGIAAISVKQNPRILLSITHAAVVPGRGTPVHAGDSAALLAGRAQHDRRFAVAKAYTLLHSYRFSVLAL
jgi:hypothetical protein